MKVKFWVLIDKKKNVPIQVDVCGVFVIGFGTKGSLLSYTGPLEPNEEVRKIEVEI